MRRAFGVTVLVVIGLAMIGGSGVWWLRSKRDNAPTFRTVPVKRGDLVAVISATGTVEPEEVVDVGSQVAGQISAFGKDENGKAIDYGSVVKEGTVLALIDDSLYAADVEAVQAQLQQAQANQISADANVLQMKAKLVQAQQDWNRAQKLGPSQALAPSAYDQYRANYEVAKANLGVAQAAVEQAKAASALAKANLDRAQRNLGYCTIKSPVNGVIIDRRVNIGQTVVASLSAPSLFLIAKDLRRIQVWVSVNEADIGNIHPGQPVTFTVDSYPNRIFKGQVGKVRLNATMTQNVVTYTVEVNTDNADGKLLPYLTANARFEAGRGQDVLLVPNAALRWAPRPDQIAPEYRRASDVATAPSKGRSGADTASRARGTIWVDQGDFVRPINVDLGLTDGTQTEVEGKDVTERLQVVVGDGTREAGGGPSAASPSSGASPFMPQLGRSRGQGQAAPSGGR